MVQEKALRYNEGKPALSYILTFYKALVGVAEVCMYGEQKYEKWNYLKGGEVTQYINAGLRHLGKYFNGEDIDPESGKHHLDHVNWNFLMARQMCEDYDDRPKNS